LGVAASEEDGKPSVDDWGEMSEEVCDKVSPTGIGASSARTTSWFVAAEVTS
jgi:hypothetical protein